MFFNIGDGRVLLKSRNSSTNKFEFFRVEPAEHLSLTNLNRQMYRLAEATVGSLEISVYFKAPKVYSLFSGRTALMLKNVYLFRLVWDGCNNYSYGCGSTVKIATPKLLSFLSRLLHSF